MQFNILIGLLSLMQLFSFGLALPRPRLGGYYPNGLSNIAARDAAPEALTPTAASLPVNRDLETKKKRAFEAAARRAADPPSYTVWPRRAAAADPPSYTVW